MKSLQETQLKSLNPILIDQGSTDQFLINGQLLPDNLVAVAKDKSVHLSYRLQEGYGHSYAFVSTFMEDHLKHHAQILLG